MIGKRIFLLALMALVVGTASSASADPKECEVCVKVVDDVKGVYTKLAEEKGKKLAVAEKAVEKYCSKKLSSKDQKLCYFLEPMKKDVARQISFGKDSIKICKTLEKKNPDFCSMRYPVKTDSNTDYTKLRVKQLKKILGDRGVECVGCVEKSEFIAKIKETEHLHAEL
ncbi:hypothetical protein Poli38472_003206 [Pythium oligandrum]|uniref:Mesencephalic astrocyte-derived neurotrophic factor homolog n=1 Tax=Pythium oligandrum TaxID=41045 RepID=A0A8K1C6F3_PYTOL|nr:hypothetical protein Poli38472_003206 [Pythium oligandrum]|eukprot:TMW57281.1 hypothetical protein Poli38472_003206 [Pythium oligandrum]